jgi:biotin transport system substrate-specific component
VSSAAASASPSVRVLGDVIPGERVRDVLLTLGYAGAIGVSAQIAFPLPFTPVPVTGQTFAVLLGAIVLGMGRAATGGALYLGLGIAGVPWFAPTGGGASMGYIVGFLVAAAVVGKIAERGQARGPLSVAGVMVVGNVIIYAFGAAVLGVMLSMNATQALMAGVVPFLIGDALKIAAATALVPAAWKLVHRGES